MKKLLLIIILLLPLAASAQKQRFEIGVGYPFWMNKSGTDEVKQRLTVHLDGNFRIPLTRLTAGFRLGYSQFKREEQIEGLIFGNDYRSMQALATASYSFNKSRLLAPYIGIGAGVAFSNCNTGIFNDGFNTDFCIVPSVGVLIVRHIALSVDYTIISKKYSHAALRLGLAF